MMIRIQKLFCGLFEGNKEAHPYFLFVSGFWVIFMGLALRFLVLGFWVNFRFSGFLGLKDKKGTKTWFSCQSQNSSLLHVSSEFLLIKLRIIFSLMMIRKPICQASAFNLQNKVNTVYKAAKLVLLPLDKDSIKDCMTIYYFNFTSKANMVSIGNSNSYLIIVVRVHAHTHPK